MKFDYSQEEVVVKTQEELDMIPEDYKGQIYIEGGVYYDRIAVTKQYYDSVVARGNSSVEAWENSSVVAWENSSVVARENSSVEAWGNSSVEAWGNSSVVAWENSSVVARGNAQVVDLLQGAKIKISGNARIVYMPKSIHEFMEFYGIKHTKTKATFYKAVHKDENGYFSDNKSSFRYDVGKTVKEKCDTNVNSDCSYGLHIAHLAWAVDYGKNWKDLAVLEVETKIADIVLPKGSNGKVRTSCLKVIREVPLEECGLMGKILARRKANG